MTDTKYIKEKEYCLIAFDLDGTLLTSAKTIDDATLVSIHEAVTAGKHVCIVTGRPVSELRPYVNDLKDVRYAACESGALIYDMVKRKPLIRHTIKPEAVLAISNIIRLEDMMPDVMSKGLSYANDSDVERLAYFNMGIYQSLYSLVATKIPDVREFMLSHTDEIEKINLYHTTPEARERTMERLRELPVDCVFSECSSLEVSAAGIDKALGLSEICNLLSVPIEESIAVGDDYNDISMINAAGLGVAMGNSYDDVKTAADIVTSDCDHDGCGEIIRRYLLG